MALMVLRGHIPDLISIGLANLLILLTFAFFYRGYASLLKSSSRGWWILIVMARCSELCPRHCHLADIPPRYAVWAGRLMARADAALYAAQRAGGNQVIARYTGCLLPD